MSKCHFFYQNIYVHGHNISAQEIQPLDKNLKAITEFPTNTKTKDVRSFLGASNYRKFILRFSDITKPLMDLKKKKIQIIELLGEQKNVGWHFSS